jgi:hypothetical protein
MKQPEKIWEEKLFGKNGKYCVEILWACSRRGGLTDYLSE